MKIEHRVRSMEPAPPANGDRVTQAVMDRLSGPPAPLEELAAQLIGRAELSRTRRRRLRRAASFGRVPGSADRQGEEAFR